MQQILTPNRKFITENTITINTSANTNSNYLNCGNTDINSNSSSVNNSPNLVDDKLSPGNNVEYNPPDHFSRGGSHPNFFPQTTTTVMSSFGGGSISNNGAIYCSTFPVLSTPNDILVSPSSSSDTTSFQMMPHLMNSFVWWTNEIIWYNKHVRNENVHTTAVIEKLRGSQG